MTLNHENIKNVIEEEKAFGGEEGRKIALFLSPLINPILPITLKLLLPRLETDT